VAASEFGGSRPSPNAPLLLPLLLVLAPEGLSVRCPPGFVRSFDALSWSEKLQAAAEAMAAAEHGGAAGRATASAGIMAPRAMAWASEGAAGGGSGGREAQRRRGASRDGQGGGSRGGSGAGGGLESGGGTRGGGSAVLAARAARGSGCVAEGDPDVPLDAEKSAGRVALRAGRVAGGLQQVHRTRLAHISHG
jgi:hypothetical protein